MQVVPLQAIPNQTVQVQLANQPCTLQVMQYAYGLFLTLYIADALIVASVPCENFNRIVRSLYLGFSGDLFFLDTQGVADPVYTGLGGEGARFQLIYITAAELPAGEG
jgi:hypothetical protein